MTEKQLLVFMEVMQIAIKFEKRKIPENTARVSIDTIFMKAIREGTLTQVQARELIEFTKTKKAKKVYRKLRHTIK